MQKESLSSASPVAGVMAGLGAFAAWGLLPVYWKALQGVFPVEILCHRIVWSLVFVAGILTFQGRWREALAPFRSGRDVFLLLCSSLLIGGNWLLYIWAVTANRVVETSLGYYINPLVSVLLGFVFLRERMRPLQYVAIALATAGVANSMLGYGQLPWVALSLAVSFGLYGLIRKIAAVASMPGLFLETLLLSPLAAAYLVYLYWSGDMAFLHVSRTTDALLIGAGAVTSLPLLGFAFSARCIRLSTLGILQYLGPSLAFILGVFVYKEPFTSGHLVTFVCIWAGLAVFSGETLWNYRQPRLPGIRKS